MRITADAESFHVVAGLGQGFRDRIDNVMDFVFRIGVGMVQGRTGSLKRITTRVEDAETLLESSLIIAGSPSLGSW